MLPVSQTSINQETRRHPHPILPAHLFHGCWITDVDGVKSLKEAAFSASAPGRRKPLCPDLTLQGPDLEGPRQSKGAPGWWGKVALASWGQRDDGRHQEGNGSPARLGCMFEPPKKFCLFFF